MPKLEKEFKIPIPDTDKFIYAKQYGELDKPVVVFVHGLTGHMDEHLFYNGARYFYEQGFSSIRFNLYGFEDDARKLYQCNLKTHATDLDLIIKFIDEMGGSEIFVAGHSYGGPTIVFSKLNNVTAGVLWDTYIPDESLFETAASFPELERKLISDWWPFEYLIGNSMYKEEKGLKKLLMERSVDIAQPIKMIFAEKGEGDRLNGENIQAYGFAGETVTVANATHGFSEEGKAEELYDETIKWFKKYV